MEALAAALVGFTIIFLLQFVSAGEARRASALAVVGLALDKGRASLRSRLGWSLENRITWLGRLHPSHDQASLEDLILESGVRISLSYFQGLRLTSAILGAAAALPLGKAALVCVPAFSGLGYHLPIVFLKRRRRLHWERIGCELPEMVDLMAVLCFAGESLFQALAHSTAACAHLSSRDQMEEIIERVGFGESTAEALRRAGKHPCPELRRFSRVLLRAEEHGAPIAETLEELTSEFKAGRREKERVRASRASVLILFPLVFLILPSFLLLTVGGMILGYAL